MSECDCYLPAIMCTEDNFCISWNVLQLRTFQPKNQHRLANSSSQSHSKPYAARNVSYWDSKRFRTSASHGFRTRHRLLVSWVHWAEGRKTLPESLLAYFRWFCSSATVNTCQYTKPPKWKFYYISRYSINMYCPSHHAWCVFLNCRRLPKKTLNPETESTSQRRSFCNFFHSRSNLTAISDSHGRVWIPLAAPRLVAE